MEWDLAVFPQPVTEAILFNQLLDKLRTMHEKICARNAQLELHIHDLSLVKGRADEVLLQTSLTWHPHPCINLASPSKLTQGSSLASAGVAGFQVSAPPGPRTPRSVLDMQDVQEITRSLSKIAKQQEELSVQVTQISEAGASAKRPSQEAGDQGDDIPPTMRPLFVEERQPSKRISVQSTETGSCDEVHTQPSRFAVPTGATKEFSEKVWSAMSDGFTWGSCRNWRKILMKILNGTVFNIVTSFLILSYAGLIAVETDMLARDPEMDSMTIKILHYVYTGVFAGELLLRFVAFGRGALSGQDGFWNKLDMFFVFSAIGEIIMENAIGSVSTAGSVVRAVRIGRIVRTVRLVRTFRQFHEFQKMAYALLSSMKTLICSLTLLIFVMFFFAVWFTQTAADLEMRQKIEDLELRYGTLLSTSYTLFLSVSNGISWDLCYMPLHHLSWVSAQAFMFYVSITLFGVLNVITSIFVEGVIRSVQRSRDLIVQEKEEAKKIAMTHVKEVFRHMDSNGSGSISTDELEHFLEDPELRKYMDALDIEAEDTRLLFRLLDRDSSGIISAEEFCDGCLRLKGSARSIDVHALIFRVESFLNKWGEFTGYVEDSFSQIRRQLKRESSLEKGCNGSRQFRSTGTNRSTTASRNTEISNSRATEVHATSGKPLV